MQVNLVDDPTILSLGDNTGSDLVAVENARTFSTRVGWLGLDMAGAGELTIGKQWSAYYDIAGWTDQFYVFGGTSLGVYSAGTGGGGALGTGRAEQAVVWRNEFGPVTAGVQFQLKGDGSQNAQSLGGSVRVELTEGLHLGVSYNEADLTEVEDIADVLILEDDPQTVAIGLKVDRGQLRAAVTYADQCQNEVVRVGDSLVLFDSTGYELYARWGFDDVFGIRSWGIYGGGNWREAEEASFSASTDIEQYFLGADWHFHDSIA